MIKGMKFLDANGEEIACVEIWKTTELAWIEINCGANCGKIIKVGDLVVNFPPPFGFNILCSLACFEKECNRGADLKRRKGQRRLTTGERRGKTIDQRIYAGRRKKSERRKNG